jgi:hypothetical protein
LTVVRCPLTDGRFSMDGKTKDDGRFSLTDVRFSMDEKTKDDGRLYC